MGKLDSRFPAVCKPRVVQMPSTGGSAAPASARCRCSNKACCGLAELGCDRALHRAEAGAAEPPVDGVCTTLGVQTAGNRLSSFPNHRNPPDHYLAIFAIALPTQMARRPIAQGNETSVPQSPPTNFT